MKKGKSNYKGATKMKRAIILFVLCMTAMVLTAGESWSEEAAYYDATENWIVRVYTAPAGSDYSVTLEVVDTGNNLVTDPIIGMTTNPLQIEGSASSPDISIAFDEDRATAHVIYTADGGGVSLKTIPDIARDVGVMAVSPNPVLFGSVMIRSMVERTITIMNTGVTPLNFTAIGTVAAPFTIVPWTTCAVGRPLAAYGRCRIVVRFVPTAARGYSDSILVNSDNGNVNVRLIGTGR